MKLKNNQVILCCGSKKCPILSKKPDGMIEITDDFGGKILIKEEQAKLINGALDKVSKEK